MKQQTEQNDKQEENIHLSIAPHPFLVERLDSNITAGLSIFDILHASQPDIFSLCHAHVFINDDYIPREKWHLVTPKAGTTLQVRVVPMGGGGGGKNPLRAVLSIAVLASTSFLGTALAGTAFGQASLFGITGSRLVTGALSFAGRLALNAIAPPSSKKSGSTVKDSPTLFIQGARNQTQPFGRIPQVLGKYRMIPPMGARPYTETIGNDQYLRMLFVWGYGPLDISDIKIGETPIVEFDGVEIEHRQGFDSDTPLSLYSQSVLQNDLQVTLKQVDGYNIRTTEIDADEISVDITLSHGLMIFDSNGKKQSRSVQLEIQYALAGTGDWSAGVSGFKNVASQTTANFETPGVRNYRSGQSTFAGRYYKRIDFIVIDKATGVVSVIQGSKKIGFDVNGDIVFAATEPDLPSIPDTKVKIAKVIHVGDTLFSELIDERDLSLVGSVIENSADFLPTIQANKIQLAAGGLQFHAIEITGKQSNALRHSVRFSVPKGQYDVRVKRITADTTSSSVFDTTVWTALRTIRHEAPINMSGLAMTALRIKATDQLSGMIDRFNAVVESIVPDWDGENWVEQATANPASLFRHVLQGNANARPLIDSRIDIGKLEEWHVICADNDREFNSIIDYQASVRDILLEVTAAGRASPSVIDGKWGVITDKLQTVPIQHFTPRNSFDFQGERQFDDFPHALRVRFANSEKGWQQDEMLVFDDGYDSSNATLFETLELSGITSPEQVWKDGRYHIATARLRPETYSFSTDIEYIVCTRGDLIRFTHDVPLFGLKTARVKSVTDDTINVTAVELDETVEMEVGKSYSIRFRKNDGSSLVESVLTVAGETKILSFVTPFPIANTPLSGDLAMFGETGKESVELIVQSIRPSNDLSAKLTCVDAAPAIHGADSGTIPDFDSNITIPTELQRPPSPVIMDIQSGSEVMIRGASGNFIPRIVINLEPIEVNYDFDIKVFIRSADESFFSSAEFTRIAKNTISISNIETGVVYDIKFVYLRLDGWSSKATIIANYAVIGTGGLPSDIENFRINILGDTAHLSWDRSVNIDLSHYYIRFSEAVSGAVWDSSVDLVTHVSSSTTSVSVPASAGSYLIKAVDIQGQESENAIIITSTIASLLGQNQIAIVDEAPSFNGSKVNMFATNNALQLIGQDIVDDWANLDQVLDFDLGDNGFRQSGSYTFDEVFDLGAVYTSTLSPSISVVGLDVSTVIDQWNNVDYMGTWDNSTASQAWSSIIELRTTDDNPIDVGAVWSEWTPFIIGDYTARGFDFRVSVVTTDINVTPVISGLSVKIDMPDRIIGVEDITSSASGTSILFTQGFKNIPAIAVSAQNMQTGDYYTITNTATSGFDIRFFDSLGVGIIRTFDYVAKGYGQEIT